MELNSNFFPKCRLKMKPVVPLNWVQEACAREYRCKRLIWGGLHNIGTV